MGTNLQGYHLLWPDLPIFLENQFTAPFIVYIFINDKVA